MRTAHFRTISSLLLAIAGLGLGTAISTAHGGYSKKGTIQFGRALKNGKLQHVTRTFPKGKTVAWVAHPKRNHSGKMTIVLMQTSGPGMHPRIALREKTRKLHGQLTAKQLKKDKVKPASYLMRYRSGHKVIAHGTFAITSGGSGHGGTY